MRIFLSRFPALPVVFVRARIRPFTKPSRGTHHPCPASWCPGPASRVPYCRPVLFGGSPSKREIVLFGIVLGVSVCAGFLSPLPLLTNHRRTVSAARSGTFPFFNYESFFFDEGYVGTFQFPAAPSSFSVGSGRCRLSFLACPHRALQSFIQRRPFFDPFLPLRWPLLGLACVIDV